MFSALNRLTKGFVLSTALGLVAFLPQDVQAAHKSYEFYGNRCGFEGEGHLIDSLRFMELEYDDLRTDRFLDAAFDELVHAQRELCDLRARHAVQHALDALSEYSRTHCRTLLDDAAGTVQRALELSQANHNARRPNEGRYTSPRYSVPAYAAPSYPVPTYRQPVQVVPRYVAPQPQPRSGIHIGTPRGGITFRF